MDGCAVVVVGAWVVVVGVSLVVGAAVLVSEAADDGGLVFGSWVAVDSGSEDTADAGGHRPDPDFQLADTLDEARGLVPPGAENRGRDEGDDPVIVETWM